MIIDPLFKHSTPIQLRFADMDAFGHINNANYLTYLEEARIKYLDDIIHWDYGWSKMAIIMAHVDIDFKLPTLYKDDAVIYTRCSKLGTKSFTLEYKMIKIENGEEIILAMATTVVVMYNYEIKSSVHVPEEWKEAIKKFEENL